MKSYFLSTIIFTKNQANKKSYFLAFCSSCLVLLTQAAAFFEDSFIFSETSLTFSFA
jgi:hypothetical protein